MLVVETFLTVVLPRTCRSSEYIYARSEVLFDGETAGGARVGEMTGAGDGHGVLADFASIAKPVGDKSEENETVNFYIEDSKTGFCRDMTCFGVTRGPLKLRTADHLRKLWRLSGFKIVTEDVDGMHVEHPDYSVVRVSLLDMDAKQVSRLIRLVENSSEPMMVVNRSWIVQSIGERCFPMRQEFTGATLGSKTLSQEERYVNICGGARDGVEVERGMRWCQEYGIERFVDITKGPLLRATARGRVHVVTHMPLKPGSTYTHVPNALMEAWEINVANGVEDAGLDLEGLDKPKFGNHGNRRHADKNATDSVAITGVTAGQIDDHFGWAQKARKKISQLHYHGRVQRLERARVTMML